MAATAAQVKELRDKTGAGMMDCKAALEESGGDVDKAVDILRKKGLAQAAKRAGRLAKDGVIGHYIHMGGKIGVVVEVAFANAASAANPAVTALIRDLAMQVAAAAPISSNRDEVPADIVEHELSIYRAQAAESGKPEQIQQKMA
ncbi:MAG: elongation factor Ts, partial [Acidobacteriota bacterium]|nr:elongation factor Ts [Acidobacteriota bacterium]